VAFHRCLPLASHGAGQHAWSRDTVDLKSGLHEQPSCVALKLHVSRIRSWRAHRRGRLLSIAMAIARAAARLTLWRLL
jgi:hypothetical protein